MPKFFTQGKATKAQYFFITCLMSLSLNFKGRWYDNQGGLSPFDLPNSIISLIFFKSFILMYKTNIKKYIEKIVKKKDLIKW